MSMDILNGKKINKMTAANSGYTPLKRRIHRKRYMQFVRQLYKCRHPWRHDEIKYYLTKFNNMILSK